MKDDNVFVDANTDTGTSGELKLSFTIEHMILLLMVYDGMRQIEDNLLQITGDLDNTNPESALGKLALSLFLWDEPFLTVSEVLCPGPPQVPSALRASVLPGGPWEHRRGAHGLGTALSIRSSCTDFWMHP